MSGTFQIDGELFPANPVTSQWRVDQIGVGGDGAPIFADVWGWEGRFGILSESEYDWFMDKFRAGGLHAVRLPAPGDQSLTYYTGVAIESIDGTNPDVNGYIFDAMIRMSNINLSATGTA